MTEVPVPQPEKPRYILTSRQQQVLAEAALGKSRNEMAIALKLTPNGVKSLVSSVLESMEESDVYRAAYTAVNEGSVPVASFITGINDFDPARLQSLNESERKALQHYKGNTKEAARRAGWNKDTLVKYLTTAGKKLGLHHLPASIVFNNEHIRSALQEQIAQAKTRPAAPENSPVVSLASKTEATLVFSSSQSGSDVSNTNGGEKSTPATTGAQTEAPKGKQRNPNPPTPAKAVNPLGAYSLYSTENIPIGQAHDASIKEALKLLSEARAIAKTNPKISVAAALGIDRATQSRAVLAGALRDTVEKQSTDENKATSSRRGIRISTPAGEEKARKTTLVDQLATIVFANSIDSLSHPQHIKEVIMADVRQRIREILAAKQQEKTPPTPDKS